MWSPAQAAGEKKGRRAVGASEREATLLHSLFWREELARHEMAGGTPSSLPGPGGTSPRLIIEVEDTAGLWPRVQQVKEERAATPLFSTQPTLRSRRLPHILQAVTSLAPFRDFVLTNKFGNAVDVGDLGVR